MFCYQCEQTLKGGCTKAGVCGKSEDIASMQDTLVFGLKGISAYAFHARELGYVDEGVDGFVQRALFYTLTNTNFNKDEHVSMLLSAGKNAISAMELLDRAHVETFGVPEPVTVTEDKAEGKAVLVTGHDLYALKLLLDATEGKGINVYTHSEMLPAHGYPGLRKYKHLAGNVGKAWHDQRKLFSEFPGVILGTTNCLMPVAGKYKDRMFTYGVSGLEGVEKIENDDFSPIVRKALEMAPARMKSDRTVSTGYHHQTVLALVPKILRAVKDGKVRKFFVIAGCDAPGPGGDYYRKLALSLPKDCIVLTSSCGKFRFNDHDFGTIDGIPRYLDFGQCNNSISIVKVAQGLASALGSSVNELPVTVVLSWFEQKAVAVLLGLLFLGVKDVYVGPRAPEFLAPGVVKMLADNFGLKFAD